MTYRDKTKAFFYAVLLIAKNATIVIPVLEGIVYSIFDLISAVKKGKQDEKKLQAKENGYNYRDDEH